MVKGKKRKFEDSINNIRKYKIIDLVNVFCFSLCEIVGIIII